MPVCAVPVNNACLQWWWYWLTPPSFVLSQAYRKLAKEYHPDKNPNAGDKVRHLWQSPLVWMSTEDGHHRCVQQCTGNAVCVWIKMGSKQEWHVKVICRLEWYVRPLLPQYKGLKEGGFWRVWLEPKLCPSLMLVFFLKLFLRCYSMDSYQCPVWQQKKSVCSEKRVAQ